MSGPLNITVEAPRDDILVGVTVEAGNTYPVTVEVEEASGPVITVEVETHVINVAVISNPGGGATSHTHVQNTPAAIWTIPNPFGSAEVADVTFKDDEGKTGLIDWSTPSSLYVVITFPFPRTGKAFIRKA